MEMHDITVPVPGLATAEKVCELLKQLRPVSTANQSRLPIFPVSAKDDKAVWRCENATGAVRILKSKCTQQHLDILEAIHVCALNWHIDALGQISVLFSDTDVLRVLGTSTTNRQWLLQKLDELREARLEFYVKNRGYTVRKGVLAEHGWSSVLKPIKNPAYLKNFARRDAWQPCQGLGGDLESAGHLHKIQYTYEFAAFFLDDVWLTRGPHTKTIIQALTSLAAKAIARFLLAERSVPGNLKRFELNRLLERLGICQPPPPEDTEGLRRFAEARKKTVQRMLKDATVLATMGIHFERDGTGRSAPWLICVQRPDEVVESQLHRKLLQDEA